MGAHELYEKLHPHVKNLMSVNVIMRSGVVLHFLDPYSARSFFNELHRRGYTNISLHFMEEGNTVCVEKKDVCQLLDYLDKTASVA